MKALEQKSYGELGLFSQGERGDVIALSLPEGGCNKVMVEPFF